MRDREPPPVELAKLDTPILIEAVAVALFIACCLAWLIIAATPAVPV